MNEKVEFCTKSLIDQMAQWEEALNSELEILRTIKNRVISIDNGEMELNDRVWVNKHVDEAVSRIHAEFSIYKTEIRALSLGGTMDFLEIIGRYEQLSERFQQINIQLQEIYSFSDEFYKLKQGSSRKSQRPSSLLQAEQEQCFANEQDQRYFRNSQRDQMNVPYTDEDLQPVENDQILNEQTDLQNEMQMTFKQQNRNYSQPSFLNETFNSVQKRLHQQQMITDIKYRTNEQQKMAVSASESRRNAKQNENLAEFEKGVSNEWFRNLQKSHANILDDASQVDTLAKKKQNLQLGIPYKGEVLIKKSSTGSRNNASRSVGKFHERNSSVGGISKTVNMTAIPKLIEESSNQMTAVYLLKREISRIKQLVDEQQVNFKIHAHKNVEEQIKKHKLENAMMKTQCQILKDENEELLLEFQKAKQIIEDQVKLSKELQDRLAEQQQLYSNNDMALFTLAGGSEQRMSSPSSGQNDRYFKSYKQHSQQHSYSGSQEQSARNNY